MHLQQLCGGGADDVGAADDHSVPPRQLHPGPIQELHAPLCSLVLNNQGTQLDACPPSDGTAAGLVTSPHCVWCSCCNNVCCAASDRGKKSQQLGGDVRAAAATLGVQATKLGSRPRMASRPMLAGLKPSTSFSPKMRSSTRCSLMCPGSGSCAKKKGSVRQKCGASQEVRRQLAISEKPMGVNVPGNNSWRSWVLLTSPVQETSREDHLHQDAVHILVCIIAVHNL